MQSAMGQFKNEMKGKENGYINNAKNKLFLKEKRRK